MTELKRKVWVDIPQGYLYGFPKVYDPEHDGNMQAWIYANGYPKDQEILWTRHWYYEEEDASVEDKTAGEGLPIEGKDPLLGKVVWTMLPEDRE